MTLVVRTPPDGDERPLVRLLEGKAQGLELVRHPLNRLDAVPRDGRYRQQLQKNCNKIAIL